MKIDKTLFICDTCGHEQEIKDENFPYDDGWQYLYNLELKLGGVTKILKDDHFCSIDCLIKCITKFIKENERKN